MGPHTNMKSGASPEPSLRMLMDTNVNMKRRASPGGPLSKLMNPHINMKRRASPGGPPRSIMDIDCGALTSKIDDDPWSGPGWPGPPGVAQTLTIETPLGRGPAGVGRRGRPDPQNRRCRSVGVRMASGPPGAAQTPQIEDVARSGPGWLLGRPGQPRPPKSKTSLGRGPAGLGTRGRPDPQNRRCRTVAVRLVFGPGAKTRATAAG